MTTAGVTALWIGTSLALHQSLCREKALKEQLKAAPHEEKERKHPFLHPHFLFNSLNTIRYFVRTNGKTARDLLLDLSLVLQTALRRDNQVSLNEELASVRAYLRLEQARLSDRLEVEDSVPDRDLPQLISSHLLPQMVQGLVNAATSQSSGGRIKLFLSQDELVMEGSSRAEPDQALLLKFPKNVTVEHPDGTRYRWRLLYENPDRRR